MLHQTHKHSANSTRVYPGSAKAYDLNWNSAKPRAERVTRSSDRAAAAPLTLSHESQGQRWIRFSPMSVKSIYRIRRSSRLA